MRPTLITCAAVLTMVVAHRGRLMASRDRATRSWSNTKKTGRLNWPKPRRVRERCPPCGARFRETSHQPDKAMAVKSPAVSPAPSPRTRSEEHTSELQSRENLVCRLLLEKKNNKKKQDK